MANIVDNVLVSSQTWAEVILDLDKPLVEIIFRQCRESVEEFGTERRWLVDLSTGRTSYIKDVEIWTRRLAAVFQKTGLSPGDVVTVVSNNRVDYPVPVLAAWLCGATANLLDPGVEKDILEEQMRAVKTKLVVCETDRLDIVME